MQEIPLWHLFVFRLPLAFGALLVLSMAIGISEVDVDVEVDVEAEADPGFGAAVLEMLGVGRVPMTILLLSYTLLFGGIGQASLYLLGALLGKAGVYAAVGLAAVGATLGSSRLALLLARRLPSAETYATSPVELVGTLATAELPISTEFGLARVQAEDGSLMKIRCVCSDGTIDKGEALLVIDFDAAKGTYLVEASPFG